VHSAIERCGVSDRDQFITACCHVTVTRVSGCVVGDLPLQLACMVSVLLPSATQIISFLGAVVARSFWRTGTDRLCCAVLLTSQFASRHSMFPQCTVLSNKHCTVLPN
jgi:hypothetical protein